MDHKSDMQAALDSYLIMLAQEGDQEALTQILKRWHPRFIRLAHRLSGDRTFNQDIAQDAMINISRGLNRLEDPETFPAWSYQIIRRKTLDHFRKVRRRPQTVSLDTADVQYKIHDTQAPDYDLRRALAKLPKADRLLLSLFYIEGYKGCELSAALGIPLGTVKSRLFKAREHLKSIYDTTKGD